MTQANEFAKYIISIIQEGHSLWDDIIAEKTDEKFKIFVLKTVSIFTMNADIEINNSFYNTVIATDSCQIINEIIFLSFKIPFKVLLRSQTKCCWKYSNKVDNGSR